MVSHQSRAPGCVCLFTHITRVGWRHAPAALGIPEQGSFLPGRRLPCHSHPAAGLSSVSAGSYMRCLCKVTFTQMVAAAAAVLERWCGVVFGVGTLAEPCMCLLTDSRGPSFGGGRGATKSNGYQQKGGDKGRTAGSPFYRQVPNQFPEGAQEPSREGTDTAARSCSRDDQQGQ